MCVGNIWRMDGSYGRCCWCKRCWFAATKGSKSLCLLIFCNIYCLWIIFHFKFVHWSYYWQLQHAQEEGKFWYILIQIWFWNTSNYSTWLYSKLFIIIYKFDILNIFCVIVWRRCFRNVSHRKSEALLYSYEEIG